MPYNEVGAGTQVASVTATNVDSATVAYPGNIGSGSFLACWGANWHATATTSVTVTDTRSTSYSTLLAPTGIGWGGGTGKPWVAYGVSASGGACTVTIDPNGTANYFNATIDEFTGQHATPLDVDDGETTGTSATPSSSITTTADYDLVLAAMALGALSNAIFASKTGRLCQVAFNGSDAQQPYAVALSFVGTAGAKSMAWDLGGDSRLFSIYTAGFKPAAAAATSTAPMLSGLVVA